MKKSEGDMLKWLIRALLAELEAHEIKTPLPYKVRDGLVLVISETKDGRQYEKLVCEL